MSRLFENISDSILKSLNESVYEDNKKVKNAKKQYDIESFKKPRIMRGTVDTENVGSTKSIEKKIERTPYKRPHKATKKVVAEGDEGNNMLTCAKCGKEFPEGMEAISRKDNKTILCPDCGEEEAMGEFVDESDKSGCLKEADTPFVDNLVSDIEDGMFSWEEIARACLKYMSDEDIRDMCRSNEFYNMDDLDEEAKGEKENGGYKVDEQIYKLSQVLIPEVEGLSNKLKEKIDYLENRENKSDREQVELEKLKSAYKSFGDALDSMKAVKEDS